MLLERETWMLWFGESLNYLLFLNLHNLSSLLVAEAEIHTQILQLYIILQPTVSASITHSGLLCPKNTLYNILDTISQGEVFLRGMISYFVFLWHFDCPDLLIRDHPAGHKRLQSDSTCSSGWKQDAVLTLCDIYKSEKTNAGYLDPCVRQ